MNYLAHLLLAGDDPHAQLGGLLGDFAKPDDARSLGTVIEREMRIHYAIDSFTDQHELVRAAKAMFRSETRRFAGIVLDVYYDHCLAANWVLYSPRALPDFIATFYRYLLSGDVQLPEKLTRIAPMLARQDWLGSYIEYAGFEHAVRRLSQRLPRGGERMIDGLQDVERHQSQFAAGFATFFPQLREFAAAERARLA
jgi:acyl carrier protein phosphodiesterase